jgi:hypothetical protein
VTFSGAGSFGIELTDDATGSGQLDGVVVSAPAQGGLQAGTSSFQIVRGAGNRGF